MNSSIAESGQAVHVRPAGFWIRFFATIIDGILAEVIVLLVIVLAIFLTSSWEAGVVIGLFFYAVLYPITIITLWVLWHGRTPGKALLRIRIVRLDGKDLTTKEAIIRYVAYTPSGLLFFVNFFMLGFRKDKRTLHDLMARTKVIVEG